jgi:hypothetical protein
MLSTIIATLGVALPTAFIVFLKQHIDQNNLRKKTFKEEISISLKENIFIPFQDTFEKMLFKIVVLKETNLSPNEVPLPSLIQEIDKLNDVISKNSELFSYLDEGFIYDLYVLSQDLTSPSSDAQKINKSHVQFSSRYFSLLNQVRTASHLSKRTDLYRKNFNLFSNKSMKSFTIKRNLHQTFSIALLIMFGVLLLPFCIVSIMMVAKSLFQLVELLYSTASNQ